jgi:hypothetical protein
MVEEEIFKSKIDKKQPPPTFLLPTEPLSPLYCSQKNCLEAPLTTAAPPSETKDETEKRGNKNRKKKQRRNKEKKE